MKRFRQFASLFSIRRKIMAAVLLCIISIGVISFAVSYFTLKTILTQRICETNQATVETLANRLDEVISNSASAVIGISVDESIRGQVKALYSQDALTQIEAMNVLRRRLANYTYTIVNTPATISLLTQDGKLIHNGESIKQVDAENMAQVYRENIRRFSLDSVSGRTPIKSYLPNPLAKGTGPQDMVYCIMMPVTSPDDSDVALVLMLISMKHMTPYLKAGDEDIHTRVLVDPV